MALLPKTLTASKRKLCVFKLGVLLMAEPLLHLGCAPGAQTAPVWNYGGANEPVISWPVLDESGNVYVLTGSGASPRPTGLLYDVRAVELVSLDPSGTKRWSFPVFGPTTVGAPVTRPSVHQGDVWVFYRGKLLRISGSGELRWELQDLPAKLSGPGTPLEWTDTSQTALDSAGNFYFMPFVEDGAMKRQELWSISHDGHIRWRSTPTLPGSTGGEDDGPPPSQTQAPLIVPNGVIIVGCTTCEAGRAGLAQIDPETGIPAPLSSEEVSTYYAVFGNLRWDGSAVRYERYGELMSHWLTRLDGFTMPQSYEMALATSSGPIWIADELNQNGRFVLNWGHKAVPLDFGTLSSELGSGFEKTATIQALAATEPPAVLVRVSTNETSLLALFDLTGDLSWSHSGVSPESTPVPVIHDGRIFYIEDNPRRLVSEAVPVVGIASGTWPILGGTVHNTRAVE